MTSKISFSKLSHDEMRKLTWLTAVQFLVFGLLIPFRVLLVMATNGSRSQLEMNEMTALEVFCKQVGFGHPENTFFILCAGILCALCAFGYLHSAVKLDFYHSLPIKRERLFAAKYLGSTLTFVAAYLGSQLLAILIGMFHGAVSMRVVFEVMVASIQGILYFLCSYSGALLALMLTGKMLTTVLAIGVFGLYFPMIYLLRMMFGEVFFETALYNSWWGSRGELLRYTSPWAFCMFQRNDGVSKGGLTGVWPQASGLCQVVAITVILTLLAVLLYRARKTESAGNALAFRKVESIIKLLLTIPVSLVAALVAYELFHSPVWELFFIVLFGGLACMIMEFIYRGDIRQVLTHKLHIIVTIAVSIVIFFAFRYDVMGYNSYLPEKENLESMAIRGYEDYEFYYWDDGKALNSYDNYMMATEGILDYLETEDFDLIYGLAENGVKNYATWYYTDDVVRVAIKYREKNGKETYRNYLVDLDLYLDVMDELQKDEAFREKYYPVMTWDEKYISEINGARYTIPEGSVLDSDIKDEEVKDGGVKTQGLPESGQEYYDEISDYDEDFDEEMFEYAEGYYGEETFNIPVSKVGEVIEAYKKDLANVPYQDIWTASSSIIFDGYHTGWKKYGGYLTEYYPLGEGFTNTLEVLSEIAAEAE